MNLVMMLKKLVSVSIIGLSVGACSVSDLLGTINVKADVSCSWWDAKGDAPKLTDEAYIELEALIISDQTIDEFNLMNDYAINYNEWAERCK